MAQLNINQTPEFEEDLKRLMSIRQIPTKSEAVRLAVKESLDRSLEAATGPRYRNWIGLAAQAQLSPNPQFRSHDELWAE